MVILLSTRPSGIQMGSRSICLIDLYPFHYWACGSVEFHCERADVQIRRWKISVQEESSEPSGILMKGSWGLSLASHDPDWLSIVTTQSELRPLWTRPSKFRVKTPSEPNSEGHKTKTKSKLEKMARQVSDICPYYMNHWWYLRYLTKCGRR